MALLSQHLLRVRGGGHSASSASMMERTCIGWGFHQAVEGGGNRTFCSAVVVGKEGSKTPPKVLVKGKKWWVLAQPWDEEEGLALWETKD